MSEEETSTVRKPNRKILWIIGVILIILIAFIIGISIYNTPGNRLPRQLDLGNRYLEEQNYEQAIVEFDKAIAIDPMNADAYLGKAKAHEGMGDPEKALETLLTGYEKNGDERLHEAAVSCLEGYIEQLIAEGRYDEAEALIEKYRDKIEGVDFQKYLDEIGDLKAAAKIEEPKAEMEIEEPLANVPSFDIADIKVAGYDLLGPRLEEILGALGYSEIPSEIVFTDLQNGVEEVVSNDSVGLGHRVYSEEDGSSIVTNEWGYIESDSTNILTMGKMYGEETDAYQIGMSRSNIPIALGDSYEKWCDLLGVDLLKESSLTSKGESSLFDEYFNVNYTEQSYEISAGDTYVTYQEDTFETDVRYGFDDRFSAYTYDCDMFASFQMDVEGENIDRFIVSAVFLDGIVQSVSYQFRW